MEIIEYINRHIDNRRELTEFITDNFLKTVEMKIISVKEDNAVLGKHYHLYKEILLFASGKCKVITWKKDIGLTEKELIAPTLITFEKEEEHILICEKGTIFIECVQNVYTKKDNMPSKHIN